MTATPLPVVTDPVMEIVVHGSCTAGTSSVTPSGNTFFYRRAVAGSSISKAALKTIFESTVIAPLLAAANIAYSPNKCTIRNIQDATDLPVDFILAGVGAIGTDSEPSIDAVVCVLRTMFRGRNARGFKHFGGTSEVDTTRDILTGTGLTHWTAVRDALDDQMTDTNGNVWNPFLFSRPGSQIKKNPCVVRGADINIVTLDLQIGTMRKRKSLITTAP